jgi:hypothetical protein
MAKTIWFGIYTGDNGCDGPALDARQSLGNVDSPTAFFHGQLLDDYMVDEGYYVIEVEDTENDSLTEMYPEGEDEPKPVRLLSQRPMTAEEQAAFA